MSDQLKLQIQATIDQSKSDKEIKAQLKAIQDGVKLKIGVEVDDKTTKQGLKSYEQMQNALGKTVISQRKELANIEFKQAQAVNKYLDQEYAKRLRNTEAEKRRLDQWNLTGANSKLKLSADFETFLNENSKIDQSSKKVVELRRAINDINDATSLKKIRGEFSLFKSEMAQTNQIGRSFISETLHNLSKVANWAILAGGFAMFLRSLKDMITNVIELDTSLVELQKVSDLTGSSLEKFTNRAFEAGSALGRTGKEVIDATATFKRAGYELEDSLALANAALITTNVGDGIKNVEDASSALIAVLKGFQMDDSDVMKIVDAINETSNTAAIDFQNITEGLRRVSGTLGQTGSTLAETIGMLTGGFGQLRDIEMVSSGLIMISQRLRGIGEDGEAIDGLAPKLKKDFKEIANIDIEDENGELRSTYDILSDMARIFPTLTSKQRQYLGELASGNRQIKVLNSILMGWQDVEGAVNSATNSVGSSQIENEKYLNSIQGKISQVSSSFQQLSQSTIDSGIVKGIVDLTNVIIKLIDKVGLFNIVWLTTVTILGVRGFGVFKSLSHLIVGSLIPALTGATTSSLALASAMQG